MDPELVTLASTAATTVVKLLATDAWERAKSALGTVWRRARPDRVQRAERIEREFAADRDRLLAAVDRGDPGVEQELIARWQPRLVDLLDDNPDVAALLRDLVERDLRPALLAVGGPTITHTTTARATDHGTAYAAGRDIVINPH